MSNDTPRNDQFWQVPWRCGSKTAFRLSTVKPAWQKKQAWGLMTTNTGSINRGCYSLLKDVENLQSELKLGLNGVGR